MVGGRVVGVGVRRTVEEVERWVCMDDSDFGLSLTEWRAGLMEFLMEVIDSRENKILGRSVTRDFGGLRCE